MPTKESLKENNTPAELPQEPIPPTNPQEVPVIESEPNLAETVQSLERRIADQQMEFRRQQMEFNKTLERLNREPEPPPRDVEEDTKRFFTDPVGALEERDNRLVNRLNESLKPLYEIANNFKANSEYDKLKNSAKQNPLVRKAFEDPEVEAAVDQLMNRPGIPMEETTFMTAVLSVVGSRSLGMGGNNTPINRQPVNPPNNTTPPHVRPTNVRVDAPVNPQYPELTENDRLAMRMGGIKTAEEYWQLMNASPDKVVTKR